jgi:hypothetical protein
MISKRKTRSAMKQQPTAQPNTTELTEAELDKVNGGIIAILIGKSSTSTQSVAPGFVPPGPTQ